LLDAVDIDSSGQIDYEEFAAAFSIEDRSPNHRTTSAASVTWQASVLQQVANVLYQHRIHLRAAFRMFDIDNSGTITSDEFHRSLATINQLLDEPLTTHQINELLKALDSNGDGCLSYKEFFEGFRIVDKRLQE
jgi:Ca2+-binding EF-hand superfamily protein